MTLPIVALDTGSGEKNLAVQEDNDDEALTSRAYGLTTFIHGLPERGRQRGQPLTVDNIHAITY